MIERINKQINISAFSTIKNDVGENVPVLSFYSIIQSDGNPTFNQAVNDLKLYEENMQEADSDFAEFKKIVMQEAKAHLGENNRS